MGFLSCTRTDTNQVCIRDLKIECEARPLTGRGEEDGLYVQLQLGKSYRLTLSRIHDFTGVHGALIRPLFLN